MRVVEQSGRMGTFKTRNAHVAVSIDCDLTDVIATVAARRELPPISAPATVAVGGGAALLSAGIALAAER